MAKLKTAFFCQHCGAQSSKWVGKCPSCHEWNTLVEEIIEKASPAANVLSSSAIRSVSLADVEVSEEPRITLPDQELSRVLGGGLVPGSVTLLGGEPGIGKSTLLLQLAMALTGHKVLYVSGEESAMQIKMRASRLDAFNRDCHVLNETATEIILVQAENITPSLMVIDSIQTLQSSRIESSPGSVGQIRECAAELIHFAKKNNVPVIFIGHITKEGSIAGPKVLEHMVDTVLQFEGDRHYVYRILRSLKNRFGSTSELGIYEMHGGGLREVVNPSEILINQRDEPMSGISIAASLEGIRPLLIETQSLVSSAVYGTPQRTVTGFDLRRLSMLLAVLEKRCGFRLGSKDVFLNIAGGIRVEDPAIDLAVLVSILSSSEDLPVSYDYCFCGEVGLSGEIRPVSRIEQRISESEKLGFGKIFISKHNMKGLDTGRFDNIEIVPLGKVEELFEKLFNH